MYCLVSQIREEESSYENIIICNRCVVLVGDFALLTETRTTV